MQLKDRDDLKAEVESIGEFLSTKFLRLLGAEVEEAASGADPAEFLGPLAAARIRPIVDRFWREVLHSDRKFFSSTSRRPVGLLGRLHRRWLDFLARESRPCFAPRLRELRDTFREVVVFDTARLDDIARRLGLLEMHSFNLVPGRVAALHDVFRGLPRRVWFEADADRPSPGPDTIADALDDDWLLVADRRSATPEMFRLLERAGAHGVFRCRRRSVEPDGEGNGNGNGNGGFHLRRAGAGAAIEDQEVEMGGAWEGRRLRRIASRQRGRTVQVVTDVLDRERLPAPAALLLATPRWRIDRLFADASAIVDLSRFNDSDPAAMEAQVYAAAILAASLRAAQGWIAERRSLPPAAIPPEVIFRPLAASAASATDTRPAGLDLPELPASALRETPRRELPGIGRRLPAPRQRVVRPRRRLPTPAPREEMMAIAGTNVAEAFQPFCDGYAKVGHRNAFIWKWVQRGVELVALPSVAEEWRADNKLSKLLGAMLDVLFDDVADNCHYKDRRFLDALLAIPFGDRQEPVEVDPARLAYHRFTAEVWAEIARLAASFPRHEEFADIFEFDVRQFINTMKYAFLVNRIPEILNTTEHDLYQPHNMYMMIFSTLDIMCSPTFDRTELHLVRQAMWRGQVMGRIGNMVSTWEREIREHDFTSAVFSEAIERGIFTAAEMARMPEAELVDAIQSNGIVEHFLERWVVLRGEVEAIADRVRSVDLHVLGAGLDQLIRNHLGSRGLK